MAKSAVKSSQNTPAQTPAQKRAAQKAEEQERDLQSGDELAKQPSARKVGRKSTRITQTTDQAPSKNRKSLKSAEKSTSPPPITLGDYALTLIGKQYRRLVKQEAGVLKDVDPECLHQMRVSSRRLRTALQVFAPIVKLPKPAQAKQIQKLAKVLGGLRDLDVQIAALREQYRPLISSAEQPTTDRVIERLQAQRKIVFKQVEQALTDDKYADLKSAYDAWLAQPVYCPLAQLPIAAALPDLLAPLLSELLLHPGWWADQDKEETLLHELRKTCKHARYQAEFFTDFYGDAFQAWVNELKQLQENLGVVQDAHVLLELLDLDSKESPDLFQAIQQQRQNAMSDWSSVRAKYTDGPFRYSLYQMILAPV